MEKIILLSDDDFERQKKQYIKSIDDIDRFKWSSSSLDRMDILKSDFIVYIGKFGTKILKARKPDDHYKDLIEELKKI